ncbi:MAG: flagellar biosynthesis protein FlhB [Acidobacteria bacterium]|nr:flagellar biosynthesis protein FlhB [Acidobacteriota bacterium]MBI3426982.1 flagellar biosynthesis protein FlhB [Acidobacteriota bacterium]
MASDKTEKATPKRREDARRKGQIARRPELPAAASFLAALAMLEATGPDFVTRSGRLITSIAQQISQPTSLTLSAAHGIMLAAAGHFALLTLPIVATLLLTSLASNFAQGGFTLTPEALLPNAERFNPAENWKKVFGLDRLVELAKQCLVLAGIGLACYGLFTRALAQAAALVGIRAPETLKATGALISQLGWRAGGILLVLAALDYGYGWYKHEQSLRMSKQEIKDEYKQQEGDPLIKGQRRRAARALAMRQLMQEVPRADVVITNPTHFAVALRYDRAKSMAPLVVAKGADWMALRIREIAKTHDVPVIENPPLARALYHEVDVHSVIPPEYFRVVAELLAYVYRQRAQTPGDL